MTGLDETVDGLKYSFVMISCSLSFPNKKRWSISIWGSTLLALSKTGDSITFVVDGSDARICVCFTPFAYAFLARAACALWCLVDPTTIIGVFILVYCLVVVSGCLELRRGVWWFCEFLVERGGGGFKRTLSPERWIWGGAPTLTFYPLFIKEIGDWGCWFTCCCYNFERSCLPEENLVGL